MPENLKYKALANGLSSALDYSIKLIISFALNPMILANLGAYLFGIWKILGQLNSYLSTGDLRAATSLKWIVSKERDMKSHRELSHIYSTAIFSFFLLLPIYLLVGGIIIYFSTIVSSTLPQDTVLVRKTAGILVITFIVTQFFFLYESVLQAMNMAHKRIGMRSIILILGGIANIVILQIGYSIFQLAIVNLFAVLVNGIAMYYIAKKNIEWLIFIRVRFSEVKTFTGLSLQYTVQKLAGLLNFSSDVMIIGYFVGPQYVAQYTFTMFAMFGFQGIVQMVSTSVLPGLGKFYGEKNFQKVFSIRGRIIELKRMMLTVGGSLICLLNESFVNLWSKDPSQFSSNLDTYLIVLVVMFRVLSVVDKSFINISLKIKGQIIVSLLSGVSIVLVSVFVVPVYKLSGLLIILLIASIIEIYFNSKILKRDLPKYNLLKDIFASRSFMVSNFIILISFIFAGKDFLLTSWLQIFAWTGILSTIISIVYWYTALNKDNRNWIVDSFKTAIQNKIRT